MEFFVHLSKKLANAVVLPVILLAFLSFLCDGIAHAAAENGGHRDAVRPAEPADAVRPTEPAEFDKASRPDDTGSRLSANYLYSSRKETLSVDDLLSWDKWGNGYFGNFRNRAVQMTEDPHSEGIMLVSPKSYGRDVVVTFDVMTLRPATVLVFMHSISDGTGSESIVIPSGFDGAMSGWPSNATSYFFAFHNAPHFRYPFVNRWGPDGVQLLQEAGQDYMTPGKWHSIEVGRSGGQLWLKIDGERVLDVTDPDPFGGGHLAFRIRGSGTERASCFIKDVIIHSNSP